MRVGMFAAAAALLTSPALAQDVNLDVGGSYGKVTLNTGFAGPYKTTLPAGGPETADGSGPGCNGYIPERAIYSVDFTAGAAPLFFAVSSHDDTTLAVHTPDGRWLCDDDSFGDHNPIVRVDAPQSGRYQIFIGVYSPATGSPDSILQVSEGDEPPKIEGAQFELQ